MINNRKVDFLKWGVLKKRFNSSLVTPYGFVVLILLFQRTYGSFSDITMDYQIIATAASALTWLVLFFLPRFWQSHTNLFFCLACISLASAFMLQELILLTEASPGSLESKQELVVASAVLFSLGYALYCRLWLSAYEKNKPSSSLIYIAAASGISSIIACAPPLLFGTDLIGGFMSFTTRLGVLALTFVCLNAELKKPIQYEEESATTATCIEVWSTIKVILIAVVIARITQGLFLLDEATYKEFGAQILIVVSPIMSIIIITLTRRLGSKSNYISVFYGSLVMFASILLLVSAAVADSSIGFLWVLQFAAFAQFDIALMGVLASIRKSFGKQFFRVTCAAFFIKELAFVAARILRDNIDPSQGSLICVILLVGFLVFAIIISLLNSISNSSEQEDSASIPESLSKSISEHYGLTPREQDVLLFLFQGRSYTSIGYKLFISKSTVKTHANHIYAKIGVTSRDELLDLLNPNT